MVQIIGFAALGINLFSMSFKDLLFLRVGSLIANILYVVYGLFIQAAPIYIGCSIMIVIHILRLLELKSNQKKL